MFSSKVYFHFWRGSAAKLSPPQLWAFLRAGAPVWLLGFFDSCVRACWPVTQQKVLHQESDQKFIIIWFSFICLSAVRAPVAVHTSWATCKLGGLRAPFPGWECGSVTWQAAGLGMSPGWQCHLAGSVTWQAAGLCWKGGAGGSLCLLLATAAQQESLQ